MQYSEAKALLKTARDPYYSGKPIANNTRIRGSRGKNYGDVTGDIHIRLHSTDIVTLHKNGNYTLRTGGWDTVTTRERINRYTPTRFAATVAGYWHVQTIVGDGYIDVIPFVDGLKFDRDGFALKTQTAQVRQALKRAKHGVAQEIEWRKAHKRQRAAELREALKRAKIRAAENAQVHELYRTELRYAQAVREHEAALARAKREAEQARREYEAILRYAYAADELRDRLITYCLHEGAEQNLPAILWIAEHAPEHEIDHYHGTVELAKVVSADWTTGDHYGINRTVAWEIGQLSIAPDYDSHASCGRGLHFSATHRAARNNGGHGSVELVCAVDIETLIPLGGKCKARKARTLREATIWS